MLAVLAAAWTARPVFAAEPTAQDRATARELAADGHRALEAGDYTLAVDLFKRAEALVHAPTILVDLGRSYVGLARLVEAHEVFQRVIREGVPANAPAPWRRAVEMAAEQDAALEPRLAWVIVRAEGADAPAVKVDDEVLPPAALGIRRAVNPGRHTIVAEAKGFLPARATIEFSEGETREVQLPLERDPNYLTRAPAASDPAVTPVTKRAPPPRTAALVAYGVGGVGLILSGVSSALMLRARADLEAECSSGQCPARASDDLSSYHTFGTLAAIGLGIGLAGAGVGTYFLLVPRPGGETEKRYTVTGHVSPGYVGVSGRF